MSWTFGGVRIYTQEHTDEQSKIIARLQPINANTILHFFGDDSSIAGLQVFVATQADIDTLEAANEGTTSLELVSPEGSLGDWFFAKLAVKRLPTINLVLFDRPGLDCGEPFFEVTMELYADE